MQTTTYKDIEVCEHSINVKFCVKCKDLPKSAPKLSLGRSMWLKIQEVLADHQWHTTKDIAEKTGLLEGDAYADIGRTIRKFRDEDHVPVDSRKIERIGEYRLTLPEEAEEFWARHEAEKVKQRNAVVNSLGAEELGGLRAEIARQKAINAELEKQNKYLNEYVAELEAELGKPRVAESVQISGAA